MKIVKLLTVAACAFALHAAYAADTAPDKDKAMNMGMHDKMPMMDEEMKAIMNEKDPAKKNELMARHMANMHENMQMMQKGSMDMNNGMMERMHMMEQRMDKMQHDMDGMMGKQTGSSTAVKPADKAATAPADKKEEHKH